MDTTIQEKTSEKEPTQMRLRAIPPDVRRIILLKQADKKIRCGCMYSMEQTIYAIIRESEKGQK